MASGWRSTRTGSVAAARRAQPHYDAARCKQGRQDSKRFLQQIAEEAQTVAATHEHLPDERETLFVALKLETSLGVEAARVASSFLVSSAAMGQWLVRDKKQNPSTVGQSPKDRDGHLNSENLKSLAA